MNLSALLGQNAMNSLFERVRARFSPCKREQVEFKRHQFVQSEESATVSTHSRSSEGDSSDCGNDTRGGYGVSANGNNIPRETSAAAEPATFSEALDCIGLANLSDENLISTRVPGARKTRAKGRKPQLSNHLQMIQGEFVGRPQIELYHAVLNALIRRELFGRMPIEAFFTLWSKHRVFLTRHLDLRWLSSACDTLCDHSPDRKDAALALAVSIAINTVKLYETERKLQTAEGTPLSQECALAGKPFPLFDGLTAFAVGRGDMIANLCRRAARFDGDQSTLGGILVEVLNRLKTHDTVYARFRAMHTKQETLW